MYLVIELFVLGFLQAYTLSIWTVTHPLEAVPGSPGTALRTATSFQIQTCSLSPTVIVYIAWDLFECAVIWFCAVETKGRTLEELNEIFEDPNPVKASTRKHKVAIVEKGDGKELITV